MSHADTYLFEAAQIVGKLDTHQIDAMAEELAALRDRGGRLFLVGLGGSAANCSHAANDFRKLAGLEAYALSDNVAELTARANDEGWGSIYADMLTASKASLNDALFVLSVGGGSDGVSMPIIGALQKAREEGMFIYGIVGRNGGATKEYGDCVIVVPTVNDERVTPHTEAMQSVILHCLVSHHKVQQRKTKW